MERSCGYCYANLASSQHLLTTVCSQCNKRFYCNTECQSKDWNQGRHRQFCCEAGEIHYDYAITEIEGKGKGMIALRDFYWGERIAIERMLLSRPNYETEFHLLSPNEETAMMSLMPYELSTSIASTIGSVEEETMRSNSSDNHETLLDAKFDLNAIRCEAISQPSQSVSGLFIHLSRCNHECQPNGQLSYLDQYQTLALIACKPIIRQGEEITISYIRMSYEDDPIAMFILTKKWHFTCHCLACIDSSIRQKMKLVSKYNRMIVDKTREHLFDEAMAIGHRILTLYDELSCYNPAWYWKTYYELFQLAAIRQSTLHLAIEYIRLAMSLIVEYMTSKRGCRWPIGQLEEREEVLLSTMAEECDDMEFIQQMNLVVPGDGMKIKRYFDDPTSYPFYLWVDGGRVDKSVHGNNVVDEEQDDDEEELLEQEVTVQEFDGEKDEEEEPLIAETTSDKTIIL